MQEIVPSHKRIHIYFCSTGTTALKLAEKLRERVSKLPDYHLAEFDSLNAADLDTIKPDDVVLVAASTTGNGSLPANGRTFEAKWPTLKKRYHSHSFNASYSIFGIGDSAYAGTYNAASVALNGLFSELGARPIAGGLKMGDVSMETLPMTAFNRWWDDVQSSLNGEIVMKERPEDCFHDQGQMIQGFRQALLVAKETPTDKILSVELDLQGVNYKVMDHLRLLPSNSPGKVKRALAALGVTDGHRLVPFNDLKNPPSFDRFLTDFVDLEGPFKSLDWLRPDTPDENTREAPVIELFERYPTRSILGGHENRDYEKNLLEICLDMPLLRPRTFSVASAPGFRGINIAELLIRFHSKGRLSDIFLSNLRPGDTVKVCMMPSAPCIDLIRNLENRPLIAITTGSGFAPIRGLIQRRLISINAASTQRDRGTFQPSPLGLFVGYKAEDRDMFEETLITGRCGNLIDELVMVPSNRDKIRVQDAVEGNVWVRANLAEAAVYICGGESMVKSAAAVLSRMLGADVRKVLGSRYVEEIF